MIKRLFIFVIPFCLACVVDSTRGSSGSDTNSTTSDVSSNLETVSQGFTPNSLEASSSAATLKNAGEGGDDPCAEAADLYDCQPILLRLYLDMAQSFVDMTKEIVGEIGTGLGELPDGSSGTETIDGDTVQYSKESATNYSLLLTGSSGSAAYFDVNETVYTLQMDLGQLEEAGGETGKLDIVVTYTDETTWSIVIFLSEMACDPDDARAPERIHIRVARSGSFWTGKAMFYNGRWLGNTASCSIAESDELSMNFYTDFVANDTAAKASVYLMSRTKTDLSDIENFGMNNFSINFSNQQASTTSYANPFCNPASTLDALWNNNCSSIDETVGSASYGPASDWVTPNAFYQLVTTLPTSLP